MWIIDCNTCFRVTADRTKHTSVATLLTEMEQHDVTAAWTYSLRGLYLADEGNTETLQVAIEHPLLVPVATIDPNGQDGVQTEIARCLQAGMRLFRLFPAEHRWHLDSQPFRLILDQLRGTGTVLLLSSGEWGNASTIARLTADCELPVVLMNMHYTQFGECIAVMQRWQHVYAATNRLTAPGDVETLVREVGAQRLLFGSEAPERPLQCALNHIWFANVSDADRAAIFSGNAERLLARCSISPTGTTAARREAQPPPRSPIAIVDVHAHLGRLSMMPARSVTAIMTNCEKYNIQVVIASSLEAIAYDFVEGNKHAQEIIAPHPWLYGYIVVNPNDLAASEAELDLYADDAKFVGVKIHGEYACTPTASPLMHALFAEVARRDKPVKIHNTGEGWDRAIVAYAQEFPRLKIIIAHAGSGKPVLEAIDAATKANNIYLEFCSTFPKCGLIREAITRVGVERILYGSDQLLIDPGYVLGAYQDAQLSVEEWAQIAWRNPTRVFRLPQRRSRHGTLLPQ